MATNIAHDGRQILMVDSTICVEGCDIHVDVFMRDATGQLVLLPATEFLPEIHAGLMQKL